MNPSSSLSISGLWLKSLLVVIACVFSFSVAAAGLAAEPKAPTEETISSAPAGAAAAAEEKESGAHEHGLPPASPVLAHLGPFPINSSMVLMWVVALVIIGFAQYATRQIKEVPEGAQNFWEFLVESLRDFLESIIGRALVKKTFWFFASIFIFILFTNWFGLIPGVGTIGWGHPISGGFEVTKPLFRGANADLNMTLAMASIFFASWIIWALQSNGFGGFIIHIFGAKGEMPNPAMKIGMGIIFALVGCLEVVSIMFRPVSRVRTCWKACRTWSRCWPHSSRFHFISWSCWSVSSKRLYSCC